MLTEERHERILQLLDEKGSVTIGEITKLLRISESTARRDITALNNAGKLIKVFGGAVASDNIFTHQEPTVAQKSTVNMDEKERVARYAVSLIEPHDFVYLDAGTTTGCMLDWLTEKQAMYVTNAVTHAKRLAALGYQVMLIGGELKGSTEAVIGSAAVEMLHTLHFTKGFFGANGITRRAGYTTPDMEEALVKKAAIGQCKNCYMLTDSAKFGVISSVTFAPFEGARILTDKVPVGYEDCSNIILV